MAALKVLADARAVAVVMGGLDQEPARVTRAGFGDRALAALEIGGVLGGDDPEEPSGNTQGAADELLRWQNQNGHRVPGLLNRRNAERCYFLHGNTACRGPMRDARAALARARLKSGRARAGKPVELHGVGFKDGSVRLVAYVPGISPYRRIVLHARADQRGQFTLPWRVPRRITDTLRWKITANQGHRSTTRFVRIKRA